MSGRRSALRGLARWIDALPRGVVFAMGLVAVVVVGIGDELTGAEVHFTLLYLLAVAFGSWFVGLVGGLGLALASAVAWWAADVATRAYSPSAGVQAANFAMELAVFAGAAVLLASLRARIGREAALARTDVLTGLLNRRGFLEVARREIARAARTGRPLTVALVDVDGFKEVNDTHGHEAGDHLLRGLGAALRSAMRAVDACARLGGDEFVVVLPDTEAASVGTVLDRLRLVLVQAAAEKETPVTVSLGAVTFERAPLSVDEMLRAADRLLYDVKANGRDGVRHDRIRSPSS